MKSDPFSGAVYVFRAKRADRVKLIYWDGTGVCLFAKRLEDGKFRWPNVQDGVMRLSAAEFSALFARAGPWRPRFPVEGDHGFRWMTTTCSGRWRPGQQGCGRA